MQSVASFRGVSKNYPLGGFASGTFSAVQDITFDVRPGEVLGLVGPNRAGKTTLIKMLLTLTRVSKGELLRFGEPARRRRTLARVGYLHENQAFPRYLSARSLLHYYGRLAYVGESPLRERTERLLDRVGLADRAAEPIGRFSKGMVQRLALAQALVNSPDLLVLDEPMEGLDLAARKLVHEVVREQRAAGKTVLFVSHSLLDIEELCDRLIILHGGRLRYDGSLDHFLGQAGPTPRSLERVLLDFYQGQCN